MMVSVIEWLALPTSDNEIPGSNPAGSEIQFMAIRRFIARILTLSPFHSPDMT